MLVNKSVLVVGVFMLGWSMDAEGLHSVSFKLSSLEVAVSTASYRYSHDTS